MTRRHVALFATIVALVCTATARGAVADGTSATPIVYSATYMQLLALFPAGYASNGCELSVALSGGTGVCTAEFAPVWFYPDGTTGGRRWIVDPSSPTGWSLEPDPCDGAFVGTDPGIDWYPLYMAWLDWIFGLAGTPPDGITDLQGGCLMPIYGL